MGQRHAAQVHDAAARQVMLAAEWRSRGGRHGLVCGQRAKILFHQGENAAPGLRRREIAQQWPLRHLRLRQLQQADRPRVAHGHNALRIDHHQPLVHRGQRRRLLLRLGIEPRLAFPQCVGDPRQLDIA